VVIPPETEITFEEIEHVIVGAGLGQLLEFTIQGVFPFIRVHCASNVYLMILP
jgi:hypothetical protein